MKFARYWTRAEAEGAGRMGSPFRVRARGWSDESIDAARARAQEIAQRVVDRIASGPAGKQRYPYGDRPLPEPVLREFEGAIVTRNAYGAVVLNAAQMMFIDIDHGASGGPPSGIGRMLGSLFGRGSGAAQADPMIATVEAITQKNGLAARLYRTAAGYRVLVTSAPFEAASASSEALLREFGADPLYVRLCKMQESFRARLSPKPWRCNQPNPPVEFPFETAQDQARFSQWEREYNAKSEAFATCRFVGALGSGRVEPEFRALIDYHDQETKASTTLRLA